MFWSRSTSWHLLLDPIPRCCAGSAGRRRFWPCLAAANFFEDTMQITVTVLGRSAIDRPYAQLVAPAVIALTGGMAGFTPVLPAAAAGLDLALRIAPDCGVTVWAGTNCDPATRPGPTPITDGTGNVVGEQPAPVAMARAKIGISANYTRDVPFGARETFSFQANSADTPKS